MRLVKRARAPRWLTRLAFAAAIGAGSLATGCYAQTGVGAEVVYGYPVVRAEVVPAYIEHYPRVHYHGSYAYYVDGRWYYREPRRGWVVFREEPRELRRYRVDGRWERAPAYRPSPVYRERRPELGSPRERGRRRYPR